MKQQHLLVYLVLALIVSVGSNTTAQAQVSASSSPITWSGPILGVGGSLLFENSNDRRYQVSVSPPLISIGLRADWLESSSDEKSFVWNTKLEFSIAETRDGNETITVLRKRNSFLFWLSRDFGRAQGWVPYIALGMGYSQRETETKIQNFTEKKQGNWLGTYAMATGVRAHWSRFVTARIELRYELGDAQSFLEKTNDARLGVASVIETMF
jgi:hypothetical protein